MTKSQKLMHCVGCRDDFYNHPGQHGSTGCWMLEGMKLVWRKAVPVDQRPPWMMPARRVPSCYRRKGYVFLPADRTC